VDLRIGPKVVDFLQDAERCPTWVHPSSQQQFHVSSKIRRKDWFVPQQIRTRQILGHGRVCARSRHNKHRHVGLRVFDSAQHSETVSGRNFVSDANQVQDNKVVSLTQDGIHGAYILFFDNIGKAFLPKTVDETFQIVDLVIDYAYLRISNRLP
jgi:hypothetical protein